MSEEEKELDEIGMEALLHAKKAFMDYLENEYLIDPAYFDIRFTAWIVSSDFSQRLNKIEIEAEVKT